MDNWLKEIAYDDLPQAYQDIADIIGIENALKLSDHLGGILCYYPKLDSIIAKKKTEYILKNFNGSNQKELAKKCNFSEVWIYKLLAKGREKKKADRRQLEMF